MAKANRHRHLTRRKRKPQGEKPKGERTVQVLNLLVNMARLVVELLHRP